MRYFDQTAHVKQRSHNRWSSVVQEDTGQIEIQSLVLQLGSDLVLVVTVARNVRRKSFDQNKLYCDAGANFCTRLLNMSTT